MADEIGYFPQMIISSIATLVLLLILAVREFDIIGIEAEAQRNRHNGFSLMSTDSSSAPFPSYPHHPKRAFTGSRISSSTYSSQRSRPPQSPTSESTSSEVAEWERYRMSRHLAGHFVFPPVSVHRSQTSSETTVKPFHRKTRTMMRIAEVGDLRVPLGDR